MNHKFVQLARHTKFQKSIPHFLSQQLLADASIYCPTYLLIFVSYLCCSHRVVIPLRPNQSNCSTKQPHLRTTIPILVSKLLKWNPLPFC